jgi:anti-anti-sigma regulatory factor
LQAEVLDTAAGVEVRLRGQAGVLEVRILEAVLLRLAARRPACVIFDLSKLESLSSLAMGLLVAYRRAAVRAGGRVCLTADLQLVVREALDRAQVMSLFDGIGTVEQSVPAGAIDGRKRLANAENEGSACLTWARLVELEPQLETLLRRAREAGTGCRTFTDADRAFSPVRHELTALIGFAGQHHRHPVLGSTEAYQVAYSKLYDAVAGLLPSRADRTEENRERQAAPGNILAPCAG